MAKRFTLKTTARHNQGVAAADIKASEAQEQILFMRWLELTHPRVFVVTHHSPNGEKRDKVAAAKLKRMGTKKGFPDLVSYFPAGSFRGIVVECKSPGESPTPEQEFWLRHFEHMGYWVAVLVGYDALVTEYQRFLAIVEGRA